mmetsp:Transcript_14196/g.40417  ORF Transcript_14196/g.40417 Transcript_14196/m.40417 type:complete len:402 (+) Transcript_14196:48-1253(+)
MPVRGRDVYTHIYVYAYLMIVVMTVSGILCPLDRLQVDAFLHHLPQRTHFAQPCHVGFQQMQHEIDFFLRRETPDAESQAAVCQFVIHAERSQHVTGFQRRRGAGRTRTDGNILQRHQQALALNVRETVVQATGVVVRGISVSDHLRDALFDSLLQLAGQVRDPLVVVIEFLLSHLAGGTETNAQEVRQGAGSQTALLPTTRKQWLQTHPRSASHVERTNSLRPVHLVRGHAHQVDLQFVHIDGQFAHHLGGVAVEDDLVGTTQVPDFGERLECPDFVVDSHHTHEDGIIANGRLQLVHVDAACPVLHWQIRDVVSLHLQGTTRIEYAFVLRLRGDDMLAAFLVEMGGALDGEVVGFRCTAREDDLFGTCLDQIGDLGTSVLHDLFGLPTERVSSAVRVAV